MKKNTRSSLKYCEGRGVFLELKRQLGLGDMKETLRENSRKR